jgi:L,D-peptidoglycan transpeptidase YkuD (ErfK/YbiS/YcfS/YnhG family)
LGFALLVGLPLSGIRLFDSSRTPSHESPAAKKKPAIRTARPARRIPGLGKARANRIPSDTDEVVLVEGAGEDSSRNIISLWARTQTGWGEVLAAIPGYNGASGWTAHHRSGDRRTPIGVFTLTEAGGSLPNPGTRLPYQYDPAY